MYPYWPYSTPSYHHHQHGYMGSRGFGFRRGPSRLIWFFIGAGAATWWIKSKNRDANGGYGYWNWHCGRPAVQAPPPPMQAEYHGESTASAPPTAVVQAAPSPQVPPRDRWNEARQSWHGRWQSDQDREQFNRMSKQAADTMADLTESTLESVLSTAEVLKAKLAEHRARREQEQKMLDQRMEEQRRSPPRLV